MEAAFELTDTEKYEKKVFSCLRLISEEAFTTGIARMKRDIRRGTIPCVSNLNRTPTIISTISLLRPDGIYYQYA